METQCTQSKDSGKMGCDSTVAIMIEHKHKHNYIIDTTMVTWKNTSRYNSSRLYDLVDNILTVTCDEVYYYSFSEKDKIIQSVDPDGGPYISIGGLIHSPTQTMKTLKIVSHKRTNRTCVIVIEVEIIPRTV